MADRIRRIFGGNGNEVIVSALSEKDNRVKEKSDSSKFVLTFDAKGFDKANMAVSVIDGKRVQIVAARREQVDDKTWADETVFYEHTPPSGVDARSVEASWTSQKKKKLVITGTKTGSKTPVSKQTPSGNETPVGKSRPGSKT